MAARGRLIVLEGGEGAGKSTQAELLALRLDAHFSREPGGTAIGERIRALALDRTLGHLDARAELLLMVAARAQHVAEVIRPALESGRDVVCDRFAGSTLAYQGFGRGLPLEDVEVACALAADGVSPDLTVLLELPPSLAQARRCGMPDRIEAETAAFHERVLAGFAALAAADDRWAVVSGEGSIEEVASRIHEVVSARLGPSAREVSR